MPKEKENIVESNKTMEDIVDEVVNLEQSFDSKLSQDIKKDIDQIRTDLKGYETSTVGKIEESIKPQLEVIKTIKTSIKDVDKKIEEIIDKTNVKFVPLGLTPIFRKKIETLILTKNELNYPDIKIGFYDENDLTEVEVELMEKVNAKVANLVGKDMLANIVANTIQEMNKEHGMELKFRSLDYKIDFKVKGVN